MKSCVICKIIKICNSYASSLSYFIYFYFHNLLGKITVLPQSVQSYAKYLMKLYLREIHKRYPKWPPMLTNDYINLLWIDKSGVIQGELNVMYEHIIQGDIDYVEGSKTKMTFADLANLKDGRQPQCIVVAPGSGKTMLFWEVCSCWAKGEILQQYSVLSLLQYVIQRFARHQQ